MHHNKSYDRAVSSMGNTMDQLRRVTLELQEERKKYNQLVENNDLVCAAFMVLMQKHRYPQIAIDIDKIQTAVDAYNLRVSGTEAGDQAVFVIENRKMKYDDFVKGDTNVADDVLQVDKETEGEISNRNLPMLGDGLQEEGNRESVLPGALGDDTADSEVSDPNS